MTDSAVKAARPAAKPYKLADWGGLHLWVSTTGAKSWRYKYRVAGREKLFTLGRYPDVTLAEAREQHIELRRLVAKGIDPREKRKAEKAARADSFESIAREWLALMGKPQKNGEAPIAQSTLDKHRRRLEMYIFPTLGRRPIATIAAPELLRALRRTEDRGGNETAHRTRAVCGRVFRYAIATGRGERDVAHDLIGALAPAVGGHFAAVTEPKRVGELLRAIDGYQGQPATMAALRLAPYVFVRPGELRAAQWSEFDLDGDKPEWRIPAERMKMDERHIVPLATQAVAILEDLRPYTGNSRYVFPAVGYRERYMSDNTLTAALRRLGFSGEEMTAHGFRALASTLLNELGFGGDAIELQLAHKPRDKVRAAYNRAERLEERRRMMQAWADYLDELRAGDAKVVPIGKARHSS